MELRFPAIGLDERVYDFGCRGGVLPDLVERWGCAGANNTYLLGHAWGVFAPLLDAFARGTLRVGETAWLTVYGQTRAYTVAWIRLVPDSYVWDGLGGQDWAWNATARPSLTLQTCWVATSDHRIIVRLTS